MKTCTKCKIEKSVNDFYPAGKYRTSACKECTKEDAKRRAKIAYQLDPEKFRKRTRENYKANPEYRKRKALEWRKKNVEKVREIRIRSEGKRRAQKKALPFEDINLKDIYARDNMVCGICAKYVDYKDFSLDHIKPLSKGGSHIKENVQTSHLICNIRKGTKWEGD